MPAIFESLKTGALQFLDYTSFVVSGLTACAILYTRSAGVLYFTVGAVACSRTVKLVKRFIRQPRPPHPLPDRQKASYGMPSTHSAVITYYALYTVLASTRLPVHPSVPDSAAIIVPLIVLPWAAAIAISRTWLGHHTWAQVAAGATYGVFFANMWFNFWVRHASEPGNAYERAYFQR